MSKERPQANRQEDENLKLARMIINQARSPNLTGTGHLAEQLAKAARQNLLEALAAPEVKCAIAATIRGITKKKPAKKRSKKSHGLPNQNPQTPAQ